MNTITKNLPLGITLVLEVGDKEQFVSRYLSTAPETNGHVMEQLLDGQQRLTAVWRVLNNNYDSHTYFVYIPELDEYGQKESDEQFIYCRSRYRKKNGVKYPRWCDIPGDCLRRGMIPAHLLRPEDIQSEIDMWIDEATKYKQPDDNATYAVVEKYLNWKNSIKVKILELRSIVKNYNLPYLSLPSGTSKDVALEVFINMNTNSKPLSTYDIIVAEVEIELGQSLHDKLQQLLDNCPGVGRYDEMPRQVLNTSALLQDKFPNQKGAWDMDKKAMVENWDKMSRGLDRMAQFLEAEGIFDDSRLPTNAVLWVIAALYSEIPETGDKRGWAESILRKYLWRAFFTDRYENSAATHAYYDYLALKKVIKREHKEDGTPYGVDSVPIFNEQDYEIANASELVDAVWPKNATIRGRAVLAVSCKLGAYDFATGAKVSAQNISRRHYHHIFPDSLLREAGLENSYIAMNCALIEDSTNLNIGCKEPLMYLRDRYKWADETIVRYRLESHAIPIEELANGGYENLSQEEKKRKIADDYNAFINKRAMLFEHLARKLCNGEPVGGMQSEQ